MEITRMLTISTAHITPETAALLAGEYPHGLVPEWVMSFGIYDKDSYGWFIYSSADDPIHPSTPDDLASCLRLAHKHDCDVLCLDSDGEDVIELPVYEW